MVTGVADMALSRLGRGKWCGVGPRAWPAGRRRLVAIWLGMVLHLATGLLTAVAAAGRMRGRSGLEVDEWALRFLRPFLRAAAGGSCVGFRRRMGSRGGICVDVRRRFTIGTA